jgi:epoxyqueuosine reductase
VPVEFRSEIGRHVFGCDICQDVCPWNRRAAVTGDVRLHPREFSPPLERLAGLSEPEFRAMFQNTPVTRARYTGFLRNVAVAMGNSGSPRMQAPLQRLAGHSDSIVAEHARWALARLPAG